MRTRTHECVLIRMCIWYRLDAYSYASMSSRTHVHMVPDGRRMDRGLKYLFVEDTGWISS
jgi:hypothetical protein